MRKRFDKKNKKEYYVTELLPSKAPEAEVRTSADFFWLFFHYLYYTLFDLHYTLSPICSLRLIMLIITNFKGYQSAIGPKAIELAKLHEQVAKETGAHFAVAPQTVDLGAVAAAVDIPVYAQHIDPAQPGSCTGVNLAEAIKMSGATGTILNHSEKPLCQSC